MKKNGLFVVITLVFVVFLGCNHIEEVDNPVPSCNIIHDTIHDTIITKEKEDVHYYVKYRVEGSATYSPYELVLSCAGEKGRVGQRANSREIEIVVGPVSKGFKASALAYHTAVTSETCAAKVYVTTQIWVSYNSEPFALKESWYGLGWLPKVPTIEYTIE